MDKITKIYSYKKKSPLIKVIFLGLLMCLISCVGTVEDKNPDITKGATAPDVPFIFEGIFDAIAIAPDKVEVYFFPSAGNSTELTYVVNYDGSPVPSTFPATTLRIDYRGLLKATVKNLTVNTNYSFSVQVRNNEGRTSSNNLSQTARTFTNVTCDYNGIGNVRNLSGDEGRNALLVEWPEARREGSEFVKKPIDPDQYEIIALNADNLTPAAFDDEFFGEPDRKKVIVDGSKISHQLNGLQAGTKYYIRVRCIHADFANFSSSASYKREENNNYFLAETLSDDLSNINVDLSGFSVVPSGGAAGLNSFDVSWSPAEGAFAEYRIYYRNIENINDNPAPWSSFKAAKNDICNGEEPSNPGWFCKKISFNESSTTLSDLDSLAEHEVVGLVCLNSICDTGNFLEYANDSPYRTYPGLANFSGITAIDPPQSVFDLSTFYLNFNPPDLNSGAADGLLIELKERLPYTEDLIINHPFEPNITNLVTGNFDYTQDIIVPISGIEEGGDPYCFSMLPFVYDSSEPSGVSVSREGEVVRCKTLQYEPPNLAEFSGLNPSATFLDNITNSATLVWDTPSGGQYDRFIIFVKQTPGLFSFSDATDILHPNYSDYYRIEVPIGQSSYFLGFLDEGTYQIGALTYFGQIDRFSDYNQNIITFDTTLGD